MMILYFHHTSGVPAMPASALPCPCGFSAARANVRVGVGLCLRPVLVPFRGEFHGDRNETAIAHAALADHMVGEMPDVLRRAA